MLNERMSGATAERMASASNQTTNTQGPKIDPNFEKVLDGAAAIDAELPDKQDVRNVADGTELAGDVIKVGGLVSTPVTGPAGLVAAGVGDQISNVGLLLNVAVDVTEGDLDKAGQRIGIEVVSFGFGSFVRQSGAGDEVMERTTEFIAGKGSEKIIESAPRKEDKKK